MDGSSVMPDWVLWVIGLAALVVAVRTLWTKAIRPIRDAVKQIHKTYNRVDSTAKATANLSERLATVEDQTKELKNNSGSSLRDAVDRIEAAQIKSDTAFTEHTKWGQEEALKIWRTLASRDAVEAAAKTAAILEKKG